MAYVVDNATPVLTKLSKRAPGMALDALDHIAVVANKVIRQQVALAGRVDWHQRFSSNSKRVIFRESSIRKAYQRYSKESPGEHLGDMQRFVINKLYPQRMKAVVGFLDTRGFSGDRYRAGAIVGKLPCVKGTMMDAIGQKLEGGGPLTGFFQGYGGQYKARPVVQPAYYIIFGQAQTIAQKALDKAVKEFVAEVA